ALERAHNLLVRALQGGAPRPQGRAAFSAPALGGLARAMAAVGEVMTGDVLAVDPTATIGEAAEKMMDAGVGAVVVMEAMVGLVGIVTERDILRAVAQRARAAEARVRQWMTESVVTIEPETTVDDAAQAMFV